MTDEKQISKEIVFAQFGDIGYMAGIDLEAIISLAKSMNEMAQTPQGYGIDVTPVTEASLPPEYRLSAGYVKDNRNWERTGTYLLINCRKWSNYEEMRRKTK